MRWIYLSPNGVRQAFVFVWRIIRVLHGMDEENGSQSSRTNLDQQACLRTETVSPVTSSELE
jgi:hypothetical protein